MTPFLIGAAIAFVGCALLNAYLFWSCKQDDYENEMHPLDRIALIRRRCAYHRKSLQAYHEELCELWAVHPHSDEGDELHRVVFDDADYDEVAGRISDE